MTVLVTTDEPIKNNKEILVWTMDIRMKCEFSYGKIR